LKYHVKREGKIRIIRKFFIDLFRMENQHESSSTVKHEVAEQSTSTEKGITIWENRDWTLAKEKEGRMKPLHLGTWHFSPYEMRVYAKGEK
jgi:hypothetical protein